MVYIHTSSRISHYTNLKSWQDPQYGINRYAVPYLSVRMPRQDFNRCNVVGSKSSFITNAIPLNTSGRFVNYAGKMCGSIANILSSYLPGLNDYPPAAQEEVNFDRLRLFTGGTHVLDKTSLRDILKYARNNTDFGAAAYFNPYMRQAEDFAILRAKAKSKDTGIKQPAILNIVDFDDDCFSEHRYPGLTFDKKNPGKHWLDVVSLFRQSMNKNLRRKWLQFIKDNNLEHILTTPWAYMRGPMAVGPYRQVTKAHIIGKNDNIQDAVASIYSSIKDDQIALKSQKLIDLVKPIDSIEVKYKWP